MRNIYLFGFGFLVAVGLWPDALEAGFTLRWDFMAIGAPLYLILFGDRSKPLPAVVAALMVLILSIIGLTTQWAPDELTAYEELIHLLLAAGVFIVGFSAAELSLRYLWRGLAAGMGVSAVIAICQLSGWHLVQEAITPGGLFVNKNLLAEAGMVALVATLAHSDWRWSIAPAFCVAMGHSTAVFGSLVAVLSVYLWDRGRARTAGMLLAALAAGLMVSLFVVKFPSGVERLGFWKEALLQSTWIGHGLGSFPIAFGFAEYAHNEVVHYIYELGVIAIAPAAALVYLWLERTYEPERLVLTSVFAVGILSFPLHIPVTLFAAALAAGALARGRVWVQRDYRVRGVLHSVDLR